MRNGFCFSRIVGISLLLVTLSAPVKQAFSQDCSQTDPAITAVEVELRELNRQIIRALVLSHEIAIQAPELLKPTEKVRQRYQQLLENNRRNRILSKSATLTVVDGIMLFFISANSFESLDFVDGETQVAREGFTVASQRSLWSIVIAAGATYGLNASIDSSFAPPGDGSLDRTLADAKYHAILGYNQAVEDQIDQRLLWTSQTLGLDASTWGSFKAALKDELVGQWQARHKAPTLRHPATYDIDMIALLQKTRGSTGAFLITPVQAQAAREVESFLNGLREKSQQPCDATAAETAQEVAELKVEQRLEQRIKILEETIAAFSEIPRNVRSCEANPEKFCCKIDQLIQESTRELVLARGVLKN